MASRVVMPKLSDTMEEGRILRWLKRKATRSRPARRSPRWRPTRPPSRWWPTPNGVIREDRRAARATREDRRADRRHRHPGRGHLGAAGSGAAGSRSPRPPPVAAARPAAASRPATAAAPARASGHGSRRPRPPGLAAGAAMAAEAGLDLGAIQGTGPQGRVIKRDIEAARSARRRDGHRRRRDAPAQPPRGDVPGDRAVVDASHHRQAAGSEQGAGPPFLPDHRRGM